MFGCGTDETTAVSMLFVPLTNDNFLHNNSSIKYGLRAKGSLEIIDEIEAKGKTNNLASNSSAGLLVAVLLHCLLQLLWII